MFTDLRRRVAAYGPWPRRVAALLCLALAAVTALPGQHTHGRPPPARAVVVAARDPVTPTRLVGRALVAGLGRDVVAVGVPVDDVRIGDFVHAGDRVDVFVAAPRDAPADTDTAAARTAATDVQVVAVLADTDADAATGSAGLDRSAAEVVVAATHTAAARIAQMKGVGPFTVTPAAP